MKVRELVEGKWVAKSLDGKVRRFKDGVDAEHWGNNHSGHVTPADNSAKAARDYFAAIDALTTKMADDKPSMSEIWRKFQRAVDDSFPDADPFDRISDWLNQNGLTIHDVDQAVKQFGGADSAHDYLASMWDDFSADAEYDAMQGAHGDTYDDQWFTRQNPWK